MLPCVWKKPAPSFKRLSEHEFRVIKKSDPVINVTINKPSKSLTHVLILAIDKAKDRKPFEHKEVFKNLDVTKVSTQIEGKHNQLYAHGLLKENTWTEIVKLFKENGVSMGEFLTEKYALLLDFRPSIDNKMHGNGVELIKSTHGINIEIQRVVGPSTESLNLHVFLLQDAQLNLESGRFNSISF